ncbi:MAG: hypothetical protein ABH877_03050 [bacterium]
MACCYEAGPTGYVLQRRLRFEDAASQTTFDRYLLSIDQMGERLLQLELQMAEFGAQEPYREPVAWHQRNRPAIGQPLRKRRAGQPAWVLAIADRAQERLWRRWTRMTFRGKPTQKVVVAMARELVGYLWAVPQGPPDPGRQVRPGSPRV